MESTSANIIPLRRGGPGEEPTFLELAEEWFASEAGRLVEPANERRHIDHLRPLWRLTEETLRPRRVKEALAALLRPTGPLGPAGVNKVQATGRRIVREALENDRWLGANPFEVVRRMRQSRPTHRTLSLAECRALVPALRPDRRREVLTMLYLGPRPGEWKALRKCDVDLPRNELVIRRSNGRDTTKTGRERRVPIPAGLRPALEAAIAASPSELVFAKADGTRQRADAKLSRMLRSALVRAGVVTSYRYACRRKGCGYVEGRQDCVEVACPKCGFALWASGVAPAVRYYDLRHSAASLHREAGCDPLVIQMTLGHAPENVTDSIYTHLSPEYVRKELGKLSI